ncbi:MAG: hypothetical protein WCY88_15200 [Spongiibacteraceae bacterium]
MSTLDHQKIKKFFEEKILLWNEGKKEELAALYLTMAPAQLTFEYVGGPVIDGWKALDDMWEQFGTNIEVELIDFLINGNEVACYIKNHRRDQPGTYTTTIEIYTFNEGAIHERYFYPV